eukprot:Em0006g1506a
MADEAGVMSAGGLKRPPRPPPPNQPSPVRAGTVPLERETAIPLIRRQGSVPRSQREAIQPVPVKRRPKSVVGLGAEELIGMGTKGRGMEDDDTCPVLCETVYPGMEPSPVHPTEPCARAENGTKTGFWTENGPEAELCSIVVPPLSAAMDPPIGLRHNPSEGSHDQQPPSSEVSHDQQPLSSETSHDQQSPSSEVSHDQQPLSSETSHDQQPPSSEVSHDQQPLSSETSHDQQPPSSAVSHDQPPLAQETPSTMPQVIRRPPRPPNRPPPPRPPCEPVLHLESTTVGSSGESASQIEPTIPAVPEPALITAEPPSSDHTHSPDHTHSSARTSKPPRPSSIPTRYQHGTKDDTAGRDGATPQDQSSGGGVRKGSRSGNHTHSHSSSPRQENRILRNVRKTFKSLRTRMTSRRLSDPGGESEPGHTHHHHRGTSLHHVRHKTGEDSQRTEVLYPDPLPNGVIEPLVVQCVSYLNREHVLEEEGLFRVPGDVAAIRKLRGQFVMGDAVDLNTILDPHTVAGLMKAHFREQKSSIIPRGEPLAAIVKAVEQKNATAMSQVLYGIGINQTATLRMVAELMKAVVDHSHKNRMTTGTLGTSMGPSLFPYLPPSTASHVLTFMVDHVTEIFNT